MDDISGNSMEEGRFQTTRQLWHGAAQIVQHGKALTEKPTDSRSLLKEYYSVFGGLHPQDRPSRGETI